MTDVTVRRLRPDEADSAGAALTTIFGDAASEAHLAGMLRNTGNYLLVAEKDGAAVGVLLAYRLVRVKDAGFKIFLYEIEVAEPVRRSGIGAKLVSALLAIARDEGARSVFGMTSREYEGAREFYVATGAAITGEREILFEYEP